MEEKDASKEFPNGTYTVIKCVKDGDTFITLPPSDSDITIKKTIIVI